MNEDFGQKIMEKIETAHIRPEPKWKFLLKDYFLWSAVAVCLVVGGLAMAVVIFMLLNSDWDLYANIGGWWRFVLLSLPYVWLIFLALFLFLVYYNIRHTETGYRYRFYSLFVGTVLASVVLGIFFYNVGLGRAIENMFLERVPFYRQFSPRHRFWRRPNDGFLGGRVLEIGERRMIIRDFGNQDWQVEMGLMPFSDGQRPAPGENIRIIGSRTDDGRIFEAKIIRPFYPCGRDCFLPPMDF